VSGRERERECECGHKRVRERKRERECGRVRECEQSERSGGSPIGKGLQNDRRTTPDLSPVELEHRLLETRPPQGEVGERVVQPGLHLGGDAARLVPKLHAPEPRAQRRCDGGADRVGTRRTVARRGVAEMLRTTLGLHRVSSGRRERRRTSRRQRRWVR
jgi:hypothetical protein